MIEEKFGEKLVSVVVPVYNTKVSYIKECLNSVANQTLDKKDYEIIIVDDCSTERNTKNFVIKLSLKKDYGGVDLKIIFHDRNKWVAEARNTGARNAIGKYVVFLDSDDRIKEDYLKKASLLLEAEPNADWVYPNTRKFGNFDKIDNALEFNSFKLLLINFCANASMIKRLTYLKILQREHFIIKNIRAFEDWDFFTRMTSKGLFGISMRDSEYFYRQNIRSGVVRRIKEYIISSYYHFRHNIFRYFGAGYMLSQYRYWRNKRNNMGRKRFFLNPKNFLDRFAGAVTKRFLKKSFSDVPGIIYFPFETFFSSIFSPRTFIKTALSNEKLMTLAEAYAGFAEKPKTRFALNIIPDDKKCRSIIFAHPWWQFGGAETVLLDWINSIKTIKNLKILDIVTSASGNKKLKEKFKEFCDEQYNLEQLSLTPLARLKFCWNLIQKEKPEILFISGNNYFYILSPLIKKHFPEIKIIDIIHNEDPERFSWFEVAEEYRQYLDKRIVISDTWKEFLIQRFKEKEEKVNVFENSVDLKKFDSEKYDKIKERKLFKIPEKKFIIGFVSRFCHQKNPQVFVELAKIMEDEPEFYFIMIGGGDNENEKRIRKNAKNMNNIKIFGSTLDISKYLAICDVLVCPSKYEGYPLIGMEAAAMNVPIIATNIIGFKEQIERGNFGILYNQKDNEKDAKKIKEILLTKMKELQRLGKNGRAFAKKYHDFEKNKIKYRKFIESLLDDNS
jgi:glycosyltransferase involved in cell wall biosynthesis